MSILQNAAHTAALFISTAAVALAQTVSSSPQHTRPRSATPPQRRVVSAPVPPARTSPAAPATDSLVLGSGYVIKPLSFRPVALDAAEKARQSGKPAVVVTAKATKPAQPKPAPEMGLCFGKHVRVSAETYQNMRSKAHYKPLVTLLTTYFDKDTTTDSYGHFYIYNTGDIVNGVSRTSTLSFNGFKAKSATLKKQLTQLVLNNANTPGDFIFDGATRVFGAQSDITQFRQDNTTLMTRDSSAVKTVLHTPVQADTSLKPR